MEVLRHDAKVCSQNIYLELKLLSENGNADAENINSDDLDSEHDSQEDEDQGDTDEGRESAGGIQNERHDQDQDMDEAAEWYLRHVGDDENNNDTIPPWLFEEAFPNQERRVSETGMLESDDSDDDIAEEREDDYDDDDDSDEDLDADDDAEENPRDGEADEINDEIVALALLDERLTNYEGQITEIIRSLESDNGDDDNDEEEYDLEEDQNALDPHSGTQAYYPKELPFDEEEQKFKHLVIEPSESDNSDEESEDDEEGDEEDGREYDDDDALEEDHRKS